MEARAVAVPALIVARRTENGIPYAVPCRAM
jgi:hypothetical protein